MLNRVIFIIIISIKKRNAAIINNRPPMSYTAFISYYVVFFSTFYPLIITIHMHL